MLFYTTPTPEQDKLQTAITDAYRQDETQCVNRLLKALQLTPDQQKKITQLATDLIQKVRKKEAEKSGIEALMMHYDLSTEEGIMLMCLAEALLRIPDKQTEDLLIRDKLTSAHWERHLGESESAFVNMATWGLALTGKILKTNHRGHFNMLWKGLLRRSGEPVIRQAVREAIKVMSEQFVIGRTIDEALERSQEWMDKGYSFSYDMLGEVARTQEDADTYYQAYQDAIDIIGQKKTEPDLIHGPSISVKLSALHPRYEFTKREVAIPVLTLRLKTLSMKAMAAGISLTVDAEEADRLELSLAIIEAVFSDPVFAEWEGLGLAVQAYQKRAFLLIDWLADLARRYQRRIRIRLVKGAYWDSEIKMTQVGGYENYPVFTRKCSTDISYLACAQKMLHMPDAIYSQFATHNAYSVAAILTMAGDPHQDFEFQNLQGMGKSLHDQIVAEDRFHIPCRIYAPVGSHEDLLPYLVRRLLENGANSSFVNQIADPETPITFLTTSPAIKLALFDQIPNPKIPLPKAIYGEGRVNSQGIDFSHFAQLQKLSNDMEGYLSKQWLATPLHKKRSKSDTLQDVLDPSDHRRIVGHVKEATKEDVELALQQAQSAFFEWNALGPKQRTALLLKAADLLEANHAELMTLAVREAGKVLPDAISEVREATDFCRYYGQMATAHLVDKVMPGPTGESNVLRMQGRGIALCISPWNFPIAIFTGQIAAALVAGNCVIAKPAEQTPLVAAKIVGLFHQAGIPKDVLQLMPGRGEVVGDALVKDERVKAVLFTGSTETARLIQQGLAQRPGPIIPLIAETGGINAMIVDSSALPEQLIADVVSSAFGSAGQRCSALRVMFVQDDVADKVMTMLQGAMAEITVGDPLLLATDVGPVIDTDAKQMLEAHEKYMSEKAKLIYRVELPELTKQGTFFAPQAYELPSLDLLTREVFGPILHVVRYAADDLDHVIDAINGLGYGLTFGIQSRIDILVDSIQSRIKAGNIYVNRNMIGAVVGVQPFGGSRLSGTGPKAGGPHYLSRLCHESTLTINTTAAGGNASLMVLGDD